MNDINSGWDWEEIYANRAEIVSANSDQEINPSEYKRMESNRLKDTWERILSVDPRLKDPLTEIDSILADNDYPIEAHIGGEGYVDVADGEEETPDTLHLRIDEEPETLQRKVDNHFFQNMTEPGKLYHVQNTPLAFEVNDLFPESIPLDTDTDYLDVHVPTKQAFYETSYQEAMESYRESKEERREEHGSALAYHDLPDWVSE